MDASLPGGSMVVLLGVLLVLLGVFLGDARTTADKLSIFASNTLHCFFSSLRSFLDAASSLSCKDSSSAFKILRALSGVGASSSVADMLVGDSILTSTSTSAAGTDW